MTMTYFVEKYYTLDANDNLTPINYNSIIVRPCKDAYKTILKKMKSGQPYTLILDGAIAFFNNANDSICNNASIYGKHLNATSFEEFIIDLNIAGIVLDFETIHIRDGTHCNIYTVKCTDLHTNKVLFDSINKVIEHLKYKKICQSMNSKYALI